MDINAQANARWALAAQGEVFEVDNSSHYGSSVFEGFDWDEAGESLPMT